MNGCAGRDDQTRAGGSERTVWIDMDFRRTPKTSTFCAICQRDIKNGPAAYVYLHEEPCVIVDPKRLDGTEVVVKEVIGTIDALFADTDGDVLEVPDRLLDRLAWLGEPLLHAGGRPDSRLTRRQWGSLRARLATIASDALKDQRRGDSWAPGKNIGR